MAAEEIAPGVFREWLCDQRIIAFTLRSTHRDSIDAWYRIVEESVLALPPGQTYLSLQDLSAEDMTITPYGRQKATELTEMHPEVRGRTAVIVSPSLMARLVQGLLHLQTHRQYGRERKIFFQREEAINWLTEGLHRR